MIKRSECSALFGPIYQHDQWAAPSWENEGKWMVLCVIPPGFEGWINTATRKPLKHIYMNKLMRDPFLRVLKNIKDAGIASELKTFDGAFQIRLVRGDTEKISAHSWGVAADINASENQLGTAGNMSPKIVEAFESEGFQWGGKFKRCDPMHFQYLIEDV